MVGVWTAYADTAGEIVADDMPYGLLWCLDGSGSDSPGVSTPFERGWEAVDVGICGAQVLGL